MSLDAFQRDALCIPKALMEIESMEILDQDKTGSSQPIPARQENKHFPWLNISPAVRHAQPLAAQPYAISNTTRILIENEAMRPLAQRLAIGYQKAAGLDKTPSVMINNTLAPGDTLLKVVTPDTSDVPIPIHGRHELYRIEVRETVVVYAATETAMARALTTLHKAVRVSTTLEAGVVIDAPVYAERSVLIDVGRKYYSPKWMKNLLHEMAWNNLNTLHLHLTDNEGVRVRFPSCPDTASPDAWSAEDLKDILNTAASYYIEVIPEIETPGHMNFLLRNRPQFQLKLNDGQGPVVSKAIDFSIPAARDFLKGIITDTLKMFPDCRHVHLGADEYFLNPITLTNTPQLQRYAREASGLQNATSEDGVRHFVMDLAKLVEAQNKIARVWNDGVVQRNPVIAPSKNIQIECWSIRNRPHEVNVEDLVNARYSVKNAHGDYYFIIRSGWDNLNHPSHSPHGVYDNWRGNEFMNDAGGSLTTVNTESPLMVGAGLQVWADEPDYLTPEQVWLQLIQWMLPLGQRAWDSPHVAEQKYKDLSEIARSVAHPLPLP